MKKDYYIWLSWKPKGKDWFETADITNGAILYPIINNVSEFQIKGVGKLKVNSVSEYPSEIHSGRMYVNVKCEIVGSVA